MHRNAKKTVFLDLLFFHNVMTSQGLKDNHIAPIEIFKSILPCILRKKWYKNINKQRYYSGGI